jgi:SAM-dependent methyltransferase
MINQIEQEKNKWDRLFKAELNLLSINFRLFPCPFWELYYREITEYINKLLNQSIEFPANILEVGCGSGKGSLLLKGNINRTLVDISMEALNLSRFFARKLNINKGVKYIRASLFNLPLQDNSFDLVWNAGTIEHYNEPEIINIITEMARVTNAGGHLVIGVPNPGSLAYKKAKALGGSFGMRWLKIIPGYRNDSEKDYFPEDLSCIIKTVPNYKFENIHIIYVGSYLFRSTPSIIIRCSKIFDLIFNKYKFMYLLSAKKI